MTVYMYRDESFKQSICQDTAGMLQKYNFLASNMPKFEFEHFSIDY